VKACSEFVDGRSVTRPWSIAELIYYYSIPSSNFSMKVSFSSLGGALNSSSERTPILSIERGGASFLGLISVSKDDDL
jgi:hypothetical protein